jgi:hypothetical protein
MFEMVFFIPNMQRYAQTRISVAAYHYLLSNRYAQLGTVVKARAGISAPSVHKSNIERRKTPIAREATSVGAI